MRQKCWSPEQVFAVDSCIFDLPPALISGFRPTPEFPFVSDVPEAVKMLKSRLAGEPIHASVRVPLEFIPRKSVRRN